LDLRLVQWSNQVSEETAEALFLAIESRAEQYAQQKDNVFHAN